MYPAFDLAKNPRRFVIDGFVAINFPTMGIGTLADEVTGGEIRLSNVYIRNSLAAIKVQQTISVVDSQFEGIAYDFRSSLPSYQDNNTEMPATRGLDWVGIMDRINELFVAKNSQWGTQYVPLYWTPNSIENLMP